MMPIFETVLAGVATALVDEMINRDRRIPANTLIQLALVLFRRRR